MFKSYFKTAWRNLIKSKAHSFINITGLSVGMAVAMLIGLWVYDELSFDKYFTNYDRIGKVWQFVKFTDEKTSYDAVPIPLADELRSKHPEFERVSLSLSVGDIVIANGEKKFAETGNYAQPELIDILALKIVDGDQNGLKDINSIMLSKTVAKKLFGTESAINKVVRINNKQSLKVTSVYEDLPVSSSFKALHFIAPWDQYVADDENAKRSKDDWDSNSWQVYVLLKAGADFKKVSANIKDARMTRENPPPYKPEFFVNPMSRWHLYSEFKNGADSGRGIQSVWLFSIIGGFVLLLACINFMNLSTAKSEKRAKEVGIRKAIGSLRKHLIVQFFSESLMVVFFALVLSLVWVKLLLPFFNQVADKQITILWTNPLFWVICLLFSLVTGLIAGSYPAMYLSSFKPVKVLKGAFKVGRAATLPRKVLVVLQFSVSVILIIGTIVVLRQINYSKDRPVGYDRSSMIEVYMNTKDLYGHYNEMRNDLLNTGAVVEMSESSGSVTTQWGGTTDVAWTGKNPDQHPLLMSNKITHDYGKATGWEIIQGRDFSRTFITDSATMILNETAAKLMGFAKPVGEIVRTSGRDYKVIGVIKDMLKESPFKPVSPSFFVLNYRDVSMMNIKLSAKLPTAEALDKTAAVLKKYNPASPFTYTFVDEQYAKKFGAEERVARLAGFFATLAIFISCLGLFGMASFMAEQRIKEIGVRKVLGASVVNLWGLLSKEFVLLTFISFLIAVPVAYYFMHKWLLNYEYRTNLSWWIFAATAIGAMLITLLTVSFQAIKAAIANPMKSLRAE